MLKQFHTPRSLLLFCSTKPLWNLEISMNFSCGVRPKSHQHSITVRSFSTEIAEGSEKSLPWLEEDKVKQTKRPEKVVVNRSSWGESADKLFKSAEGSVEFKRYEDRRDNYKSTSNSGEEDDEGEMDDPRWDKIKSRFSRIKVRPRSDRPEVRRWNNQDSWGKKTWKEASESTLPRMIGEGVYGVGPVLAALSAGRREFYGLYIQEGLDLSGNNRKKKDKKGFERVLRTAEKVGLSIKEVSKHDLNMMKRKSQPESNNIVPESPATAPEKVAGGECSSGIPVSLFDYSVENHFKAVDIISKLTGVPEIDDTDRTELNRLASSITFLTEWRFLKYKTREVKFACENESSKGKDVIGEISLPQFSSAEVPKKQLVNEQPVPEKSSKDFLMYVGGLAWGMDWCPQAHENRDAPMKSEFVAIAPHPPDSSYHKTDASLTGRGVIQIWCLPDLIQKDIIVKEDYFAQVNKKPCRNLTRTEAGMGEVSGPQKPRGRPKKNPGKAVQAKASRPQNPRGRPRKKPVTESLGDRDSEDHSLQPLAIEWSLQSTELSVDLSCGNMNKAQVDIGLSQERCINAASLDSPLTGVRNKATLKGQTEKSGVIPLTQDVAEESPAVSSQAYTSNRLVSAGSSESGASTKRRKKEKEGMENQTHNPTFPLPMLTQEMHEESPNMSQSPESHGIHSSRLDENGSDVLQDIPTDVSLPRMVLCLAHNGKIARDIKWRPSNQYDVSRHRMGYLAVILGNGTLEVWEVPFPHTIKAIYPSVQKKGTDPRFLKLQPVFRCSMLKGCDGQSIPLTVEWSASPPHDMILCGCHDGVVALWKFSANNSSKDTRPLLCFKADTGRIRALSWAPLESDSGNTNIIIVAGDKGLKFWDLRDPFRPLREYHVGSGVHICSVDWLPEPRFIVISCDDGTLKILGLPKAAYDAPVTGNLLVGTKQQGFHSFTRSRLGLWSVQASRITGMVAYCGVDGTAARFQMSSKMYNDPLRTRAPHFLCGSFSEDESGISVVTPVPNTPFRMIYSGKQWRDAIPRSPHGLDKRMIEQSALFFGDDPNVEGGSDDELASQSSKTKTKSTSKKPEAAEEATQLRQKFEKLPPKILSIHRIRWNMNKGSERWLCYGGAAGLVRCQQIDL